jgi:uncharacterized RmlC-like cupin family protein
LRNATEVDVANRAWKLVKRETADIRTGDGIEVVAAVSKETAGSHELWFGSFSTAPGVKVGRHYHTADTAAYLVSGRAAFEIEGTRVEMAPGEFLYVPRDIIHTEETVGDETAFGVYARNEAGGETIYVDE